MSGGDVLVGVDVGGTFTDVIVLDNAHGRLLAACKLPSTPADPAGAVVAALEAVAQTTTVDDAVVCHGTTVGTNTLIERRGARTALLTTRGFGDVIELRRQARPLLYRFDIRISEPLVPPELRFEVDERIGPDGEVVEPVAPAEIIERLRRAGVRSVAISFLHSYANSAHEREVAQKIEETLPGVLVTRSSEVCPEFREYERTSTAVVNAYIAPAVGDYLRRLESDVVLRGIRRLMIVKSNGGLTSPMNAARYPVHLIESGPAAGLTAAAAYARAAGRANLIAFDMGGTTAKAGVIRNGEPEMTTEFYADRLVDGQEVGGYAIRSAVLDLVEIGAGGGSIAWIDEAGVLKVGPRSAGADPGPACYGRGGRDPTVTDAHAVIGTLAPDFLAGSGVRIDRGRAVEAVTRRIAEPLGWPLARAAHAVVDIAVANMAEMVRLATVRRGLDPRDFVMLASGGAGPLHAAAVAEEIGAPEVVVPPFPGLFSALGATLGQIRHEVSMTLLRRLDALGEDELETAFAELRRRAQELLAAEPGASARPRLERVLEARFLGQLYELRVPLGEDGQALPPIRQIETAFRERYREEYGFDLPDSKVQAVNLRLVAMRDLASRAAALFVAGSDFEGPATAERTTAFLARDGGQTRLPVFGVPAALGRTIAGPALVAHSGATVWIHPGQRARIGRNGQVAVTLSQGPS